MSETLQQGHAQLLGTRGEQQDVVAFSSMDDWDFIRHGGVAAVVADGIGGHAHGGEAARLAVRIFLQIYQAKPERAKIPHALYYALRRANRAVREFAQKQGESGNCGTTLVAAVLHPQSRGLYWASVGDSRLYLLRGKQWVQLTEDGNYANQRAKKIAQGTLAENGSEPDANGHLITSFLGVQKLVGIDRSIRPFTVHADDRLVLCTDGIFNNVSAEEFVGCLRGSPQAACDRLARVVSAKRLKNLDNCTVAVLGYHLADEPEPDEFAPASTFGRLAWRVKTHPGIKQFLWLGIAWILSLAMFLGAVWLGNKAGREPPASASSTEQGSQPPNH